MPGSREGSKLHGSQNVFLIFFKIPFSKYNRLKVLYLRLELPRDKENRNGLAVERLWFLGHRALESTPFRHLETFETHEYVFAQAKYPAVSKPSGKLESLLVSQRMHTSLD